MTRPGPERLQDATLLLAFASLGAVGAAIPASLPGTAARLGVAAGDLLPGVSLLFLGLFVGVVVVAIPRRGNAATLLWIGCGLETVGLLAVAWAPSVAAFFAAALLTGIGFGLTEASATALTRARSSHGTPARLSRLNGASAVAAAVAPLLLLPAPPALVWAPLAAVSLVPAGAAVVGRSARMAWPTVPTVTRAPRPPSAAARRMWPLAAALFLFVGAETILSGWSSTLPTALLELPAGAAVAGTTVFWVLMAGGRFACTAILARGVRPRVYLGTSFALAVVLALLGALIGEGVGAALLVAAVVACVAPGYALLLGSALLVAPSETAARTASALVAVGAAGGSVLSFAVAATVGTEPTAVLLAVAALLAASVAVGSAGRDPERRTPVRRAAGRRAR
ncbi:hypothetical protein DOE76_12900 [Leifsonia sp. ku-ls]|nr:hypothetical protein DOE76_12900 [Leifsonia sp. ku-ls]